MGRNVSVKQHTRCVASTRDGAEAVWNNLLARNSGNTLGVCSAPALGLIVYPLMEAHGLLVGVEIHKDRVLGSGAYGEVFEGSYARTPVAVKHVKATSPASRTALEQALLQEAEVWSKIQHPNVVQFYGIHKEEGQEEGQEEIYLVSELMDGSLLSLLQEDAEREEDGDERLGRRCIVGDLL